MKASRRPQSDPIRRSLDRLHDDAASHNVEALAEASGLSRRYFLRRFLAEVGTTPANYARSRRLLRASYRLLYRRTLSVTDIALEAGYGSSEAFSRAFRNWAGQSPRAFRKSPAWTAWNRAASILRNGRVKLPERPPRVEIWWAEPRHVAALTHDGPTGDLHLTLNRFIAWRRATRRPPPVSATFNLLHDEETEATGDRIHLTLGAETVRPISPTDDGFRPMVIPGGRVARLLVTGSDAEIFRHAHWLLHEWLPASGEQRLEFPLYVERLKFFPEVAQEAAEAVLNLALRYES